MRSFRLAIFAASLLVATIPGARAELYDELGGGSGVKQIVGHAVTHFMADPLVGPTFADTNMTRFAHLLEEQLCQLSGGPCHYTGRDMAAAHRGLGLTQAQFNALVEDLQDALDESGVAFSVQNRLLAVLAPSQRTVVTK